jgi:hypothetical protein
MVELLAWGRGEFHLPPNQKKWVNVELAPPAFFVLERQKKTLPLGRVFGRMIG